MTTRSMETDSIVCAIAEVKFVKYRFGDSKVLWRRRESIFASFVLEPAATECVTHEIGARLKIEFDH